MNSCIWIFLLLFCCNGNSRSGNGCGCNQRCGCNNLGHIGNGCGSSSDCGCEGSRANENRGRDMDRNDGCQEPQMRTMAGPQMAPPPPRPPRPPYEDCGCN